MRACVGIIVHASWMLRIVESEGGVNHSTGSIGFEYAVIRPESIAVSLETATLQKRTSGSQGPVNISRSESQNSRRNWNAVMRGALSPPKPTPSKPVGGEVVEVSAPNPVWVEGLPGMPARTMLGSAKSG